MRQGLIMADQDHQSKAFEYFLEYILRDGPRGSLQAAIENETFMLKSSS